MMIVTDNRQPEASTVASEQLPVSSRDSLVKRRSSAWSTFAFFLLILLLMSVVALVWVWFSRQEALSQVGEKNAELNAAQVTIGNLREQLGVKNGEEGALLNMPVNDEEQIRTVAKDYNNALASPLASAKVEISKRDGDQAIANVSDVTSGYKVYLKKVNGAWLVVWSGQNTPSEDTVKQFDIKL